MQRGISNLGKEKGIGENWESNSIFLMIFHFFFFFLRFKMIFVIPYSPIVSVDYVYGKYLNSNLLA